VTVTTMGWLKLGAQVASTLNRLYGSDTIFEPSPPVRALNLAMGSPTGSRALAQRMQRRVQPWLDSLPESADKDGNIEAAVAAATRTVVAFDQLPRMAVKVYARRQVVVGQLKTTGAPERAALLSEQAQRVYDEVIVAATQVIAEMAPRAKNFLVDATAILLEELTTIHEEHAANHEENRTDHQAMIDSLQRIEAGLSQRTGAVRPTDPAHVVGALSGARMRRYVTLAGGDQGLALDLYLWNVRMSAEMYAGLALVEVALRNAMDPHLRAFNAKQVEVAQAADPTDWLSDPCHLIVKLTTPPSHGTWAPRPNDLLVARERATVAMASTPGRIVTHDDVLAQIPFGTWRQLLPSGPNTEHTARRAALWRIDLHNAFPRLLHDPLQFTAHVVTLHELRNRIAHLEPILDRAQIRQAFESMQVVLGAVDPSINHWFLDNQMIHHHLDRRPAINVG
jgi:hypothetical protein